MATKSRTFSCAAQSQSQLILRKEAQAAGIPTDDLRELLCVVNADPDLIAFPTACITILRICYVIKKVWKLNPAKWGLDRWAKVARWVISSRKELAGEIGGQFDPQGITRNAMLGNGVDRHPLYALLLSSYKGNAAQKKHYRLLQAHLLTGIITSLRRKCPSSQEWQDLIAAYEAYGGLEEFKPLENSIRDVCLSVRRMAEVRDTYEPYFNALKVDFRPRKFAKEFLGDTDLSSIAASEHWRSKRHKPLQIFLRKVFKDLKFKRRGNVTNTSRNPGQIQRESQEIGIGLVHRQLTLGDPDDKYANGSAVNHLIGCKKRTREEIKNALDADDDPFVDEGNEDIYETITKAAGRRTPSVCNWHQLQPIMMQNQLLPLSYTNLAKAEARQVIRESESWFAAHSQSGLKPGELLELRLWIVQLTMLATGSSQERAHGLSVFIAGVHDQPTDLALFLPACPSECPVWRLAAINLPYKHHPESASSARRMPSDYIFLPDLLGVSRFIELLLKHTAKRSILPGRAPITYQPLRARAAKVLPKLKERLSKLDPEGRLTVTKLSGFLFAQMMMQTDGDVTASAIVAGQNMTIARTRLFYACVRLRRVQEAYVGVFRELTAHAFTSGLRIPLAHKDLWIATRPCPTRQAVRDLVTSLLKTLNDVDPDRGNEQFAKYHNAMVLYTFLFQAYAIGTRAVNSPILDLSRIAEDGFVWVDDKDTGAHYNAHLALCPELFLEHLKLFNEHMEAVRSELLWKIVRRGERVLLAQTCFFLRNTEEGLRVEEVRRGTIEPMFKGLDFGFPVNVHRRFVSGELLDGLVEDVTTEDHLAGLKWNGVAPEIVDWWMSHWSVGEEPWHKSSSLSQEAYRRGLEKPLRVLLEDLGFRPKRTALFVEGSVRP
jgi:hypothetical protein